MLNNTYNTNYFNKYKAFTKSEPDYSQMSLREELEARFADQERQEQAKQQTMQSQPFSQPDYSQMSLADELRARLDEQERKQAAEQNLSIFPANSVLTLASLSGQPSSYTAASATALTNPTSTPQPQMLPPTGNSAWDKFNSVAEPAYVGTKGALTGAYDAGKDMVNELYQGGESIGEIGAALQNENYKYYVEHSKKYPDNWGKKTEVALDEFIKNDYNTYPRKYENVPVLAPIHDLWRNYQIMKDIGLIGADKFFHCAGGYDATKHGIIGEKVGKILNLIREFPFGYVNNGTEDSISDWVADEMGRKGAKQGLSLMESCPRNPKKYMR